MPVHIDKVESSPEGPSGRTMGRWLQSGGLVAVGLLEWTTAPPEALIAHLRDVEERIPTGGDRHEEVHTLTIQGVFSDGPRTAIIYRSSRQPTDLRDALVTIPKPSSADRRTLSSIIATQVRSLHVHFQLPHPGLRTESFVFRGDAAKPDLSRPYLLDWARPVSSNMYRHPDYQPGQTRWFYDAWALMMILSEIAEWRPVDQAFKDEEDLRKKKVERARLVARPEWKGAATAEIFEFGFGILLERDVHMLEKYSRWDVKRFYDKICALLGPTRAKWP